MSDVIHCVMCKQAIEEWQKFEDTMLFGSVYYFHESCGYGVINLHLYDEIKNGNIKLEQFTVGDKKQ